MQTAERVMVEVSLDMAGEINRLDAEVARLTAQLEAQHRKTWDFAMAAAAIYAFNWDKDGPMLADNILTLPCPPIEETKGE